MIGTECGSSLVNFLMLLISGLFVLIIIDCLKILKVKHIDFEYYLKDAMCDFHYYFDDDYKYFFLYYYNLETRYFVFLLFLVLGSIMEILSS